MNAVAVLRIPDENRSLREQDEVRDYLAGIGIDYERWEAAADLASDATAEQVLTVYSQQIEELKRRGGYAGAGRDAVKVQHRTSARRGRSPLHHRRARALPYPPATGSGRRNRGRSGGLDSGSTRHASLVRSVRRPAYSRDSFVPG